MHRCVKLKVVQPPMRSKIISSFSIIKIKKEDCSYVPPYVPKISMFFFLFTATETNLVIFSGDLVNDLTTQLECQWRLINLNCCTRKSYIKI